MDRRLLLSKPEATYGVDPVAAAAQAVWAEKFTHSYKDTRVPSDPDMPGVGVIASQVYGQHVEFSFEVPLAGSGVAGTAPKWGPLLKAAGWTETIVAATSVTYAPRPDPENSPSQALVWRELRRKHTMLGGRLRAGLKLSSGGRPMLTFAGRALHVPVQDAASLVQADAVYTGWLDNKPVANGTTTFTFDGVSALGLWELGFEQSDNIKFIDVPGQKKVFIAGQRKFTGNSKITTPLVADFDVETRWVNGAVCPWSMVHGATAGNIATVNGRAQILAPSYARSEEIDTTSFGVEMCNSGLSADDDISIVLT